MSYNFKEKNVFIITFFISKLDQTIHSIRKIILLIRVNPFITYAKQDMV